jgi:hypothetical protein
MDAATFSAYSDCSEKSTGTIIFFIISYFQIYLCY